MPKSAEWVKTELYLGKEIPAGYEISEQQFAKFLDKVVTRHIPKGLTVYEAYGQLQEPNKKIIKMATWVIVIVHEKTPENDKAIETVIDEYRKDFQMAKVLRTTSPIETKFYTQG